MGAFLFVANYAGKSLSVVDTKKRQKRSCRYKWEIDLSGLDVSPDDRYVYVTGWDTGRVWRFEILK